MQANPIARCCPTCGNELQSSGECNVCLLKLGMSQAGGDAAAAGNLTLPSVEELDAQFPQLEVTRLIGRGGMGAIYQARQTALDRDVAIKLIAKEVSSDASFVERFEREAKTLAKLSHPNIVTVFDFGRTPDGIAFLIMEFVDGINLREAMQIGQIASEEALEVVATICRTLEYAHSKGVVHRDIKPENILLGEDGTLKVADFGIAKIVDQSMPTPTLTATRQVLGSLHYLAPEHLEAPDQVDHRVDLYALGVVFYELLTGQLPLGRYDAPSAVHHRVDRRLDSIVLKSLSRKPEQRYQHASELGADLDRLATGAYPNSAAVGSTYPTSEFESAIQRSAAVAFSCEAMMGFGEAVGVLYARENALSAEFRIRDVFGATKSATHVIEIPRDNLSRLEYIPGVFSGTLVVTVDSLSALGDLPNAETGQVELSIKRKDQEYARELVSAMGFPTTPSGTGSSPIGLMANLEAPIEANRLIFGLLMILCGLLNGGGLAISEVLFAEELEGIAHIAPAVGAAVLLGPLALIQLIAGTLNLFGRPRSLNFAAAVASMLPLSPVWVLSFPTGLWGYWWMKREGTLPASRAAPVRTGWGTTTMMFIRESRWARLFGLLNAFGLVLVLAGALAWNAGYYPSEMRYRIVDPAAEHVTLDQALKSRLQNCSGVRDIEYEYDDADSPTHVTVTTWKRYRNQIGASLSVQDVPQLVWLAREGQSQTEPSLPIPAVSEIKTNSLRAEERGLGSTLFATAPPFDLSPKYVAKAYDDDSEASGKLVVELTRAGREELTSKLQGDEITDGLGLVIGGLTEGIATQISHKQIEFQLSPKSALTSDGIVAGMRGPTIPTALELLD